MAHSDVVSEPSMEEILASIRRIIENNDQDVGVLKDVDDQSRDRNEDSCEQNGRSRDGSLSYKLFSEGDSCLVDSEKETVSRRDSESLSLADVAARIRSETTRGDSSRMVSSDPSDLMKEDQKTV
ncbi:DUF2497 domain-containing protein, partial [Liberibacter sp. Z1]|nr:DUF2497 domain-containing protein [Candidatus Liberibacter sp.]